jgi:4'-phosphopantetheinyl transferase
VWCVFLDRSENDIHVFRDWLSAEERARAENTATELLRRRFVVRRGVVRGLVGQVMGKSPGDVRFLVQGEGTPMVESGAGLLFSLSHSGPLALVAMTRNRRLGVDVELGRPRKNLEGLARRAFSSDEAEDFLTLPEAVRTDAFYRMWTNKEALAKALGMGIASSFQRFSVSLGRSESPSLVRMDLPGESLDAWTLLDLEPALGYRGALAMEDAKGLTPTLRTLPPESGSTIFGKRGA